MGCSSPKAVTHEEVVQAPQPVVEVIQEHIYTGYDGVVLKGEVRARGGSELIGANIYVKGADYIGTDTDVDGEFELILPRADSAQHIIISYIGYEDAELPVSEIKNSMISVEMAIDRHFKNIRVGGVIYSRPPLHVRIWRSMKRLFGV